MNSIYGETLFLLRNEEITISHLDTIEVTKINLASFVYVEKNLDQSYIKEISSYYIHKVKIEINFFQHIDLYEKQKCLLLLFN